MNSLVRKALEDFSSVFIVVVVVVLFCCTALKAERSVLFCCYKRVCVSVGDVVRLRKRGIFSMIIVLRSCPRRFLKINLASQLVRLCS